MRVGRTAERWIFGGVLLLGSFPTAMAAARDGVRESIDLPEPDPSAEAALPDMAALERGERPRASVSFARPPKADEAPPANPPASTEAPAPGARPVAESSTGVKRLQGGDAPLGDGVRAGVYGLDASSFGEATRANGSIPDQHVVQKGDTLWSVCDSFYSDPWRWPRLWAMNPQVTNPHWIFPGDVLKTNDGEMTPAKPAGGTPGNLIVTSNRKGSLDSRAVMLRQYGFIDAQALPTAGRLVGSREEKIMLASGDQAYVGFPTGQPLKAGERYTVFAADDQQAVLSPETGKVIGYLVRVYGDLHVDQIGDKNMGRGTLVDLIEPVERGYRVSPAVRQFKRFEPAAAGVNVDAKVVASFSPVKLLAADTFVVLSRGTKDGLRVGNRAFVVRRGDGYRPVRETWDTYDARFPKELVGELWVVDARETAAVAWIARTTKEIRVGETVELRKGY